MGDDWRLLALHSDAMAKTEMCFWGTGYETTHVDFQLPKQMSPKIWICDFYLSFVYFQYAFNVIISGAGLKNNEPGCQ